MGRLLTKQERLQIQVRRLELNLAAWRNGKEFDGIPQAVEDCVCGGVYVSLGGWEFGGELRTVIYCPRCKRERVI